MRNTRLPRIIPNGTYQSILLASFLLGFALYCAHAIGELADKFYEHQKKSKGDDEKKVVFAYCIDFDYCEAITITIGRGDKAHHA